MSEVAIVVPMLPPQECSPNWRGGWRARASAVAEARETSRLAALGVGRERARAILGRWGDGPLILDAEIRWCCGRKSVDDDNGWAMLKAFRDGIADTLLNGDDRRVRLGELRQTRGDGSVTFTLRRA